MARCARSFAALDWRPGGGSPALRLGPQHCPPPAPEGSEGAFSFRSRCYKLSVVVTLACCRLSFQVLDKLVRDLLTCVTPRLGGDLW